MINEVASNIFFGYWRFPFCWISTRTITSRAEKKTSTFRRTAVRETGASRHHGYLIEDPSEAIKYQFSMVPRGSRDPQLGRHYAEKHKSLEPKWYIFLAWNYILKILIMFVEIFLSSLTRNVILIKLIRSLKINKLHALK